MAQLSEYISRLLASPNGVGTLVIQVVDAEPFLQFTGGHAGVQVDFPLITPLQRARESRIRQFLEARHLHIRSTFGSDGGAFIDVELPPNGPALTDIVKAAFLEVFEVPPSARLQFAHEGIGVAA